MIKKLFLACLITAPCLWACDSQRSEGPSRFDRRRLLSDVSNHIITPAFDSLLANLEQLQARTQAFVQDPTLDGLWALQQQWKASMAAWQAACFYNFDFLLPDITTSERGLFEEIGVFPANTSQIETRINNNQTNFNDFARDTRGFMGMEYLIFRTDANQQAILDAFVQQVNRRHYLLAVANHMLEKVTERRQRWLQQKDQFMADGRTDASSSLNKLFNEFSMGYERIKNFKVMLPLGKRPGQSQAEPTYVEAYYSGLSTEMIRLNLQAIERLWRGIGADGQDYTSFRDYLLEIEGGQQLVQNTENQLQVIYQKLDALGHERLSVLIETQPEQVNELLTELARHTRFFKSDMVSLLSLYITYDSGDGD